MEDIERESLLIESVLSEEKKHRIKEREKAKAIYKANHAYGLIKPGDPVGLLSNDKLSQQYKVDKIFPYYNPFSHSPINIVRIKSENRKGEPVMRITRQSNLYNRDHINSAVQNAIDKRNRKN